MNDALKIAHEIHHRKIPDLSRGTYWEVYQFLFESCKLLTIPQNPTHDVIFGKDYHG